MIIIIRFLIKMTMMISLVINTVRSCEDPALVDKGCSAHVQVLRLLQNCRLNMTMVKMIMIMKLVKMMIMIMVLLTTMTKRTHMPGPLSHLGLAVLPRVEAFPAALCPAWCRQDTHL